METPRTHRTGENRLIFVRHIDLGWIGKAGENASVIGLGGAYLTARSFAYGVATVRRAGGTWT